MTRCNDQLDSIRSISEKDGAIPAPAANLLRLDDLDNAGGTETLASADLKALRAVADWIKGFVARPHRDLGRTGPVCPFVPVALERMVLWLALERIADRGVPDVVRLIESYKRVLLDLEPVDGEDAQYKSVVIVFTDLPAAHAKDLFDGVLEQLGVASYAEAGLVLGGFYEGNDGSAIYNPSFRPFAAPAPFLLVRPAVVSDWKFFLEKQDWLNLWAHCFGGSAVQALAEELRRLPWRARRD